MKTQLILALLLVVACKAHAHNKVIVVPLLEDKFEVANVITVAKTGGDFTDISEALDSIKDASNQNPYLVQIGPGVYNTKKSLHVKWGVSVVGSGTRATKIVGRINSDFSANHVKSVFIAEQDTHYSNFSVEAIGGNEPHVAAFTTFYGAQSAGPIKPVTVTSLNMRVSGGGTSYGVLTILPGFNIKDSIITVNAQSSTLSYGIRHDSGLPYLIKVTGTEIALIGCDEMRCVGSYVEHAATIFITNSRLRMGTRQIYNGGSTIGGIALDLRFGANAIIRNSTVLGSVSLDNRQHPHVTHLDSFLRIINSTVLDNVEGEGAVCLNSNNETVELMPDCSVPL